MPNLGPIPTDNSALFGEEMLIFQLGDARYSVPSRALKQVHSIGWVAKTPKSPLFVRGIARVHNRPLTVVDIRPLLDLPLEEPSIDGFLLVLEAYGVNVALLADRVVEVATGDMQLAPASPSTLGHGVCWVRGVDRRLNLVIDPAMLLANVRPAVSSARE